MTGSSSSDIQLFYMVKPRVLYDVDRGVVMEPQSQKGTK